MLRKILVAGDVRGDLDRLYARVSSVNVKHGPFAMLLCVGDFLGQPEGSDAVLAPYRSGERTVPLRTYMLAGNVEPALDPVLAAAGPGGELAPDLVYLGAAGVTELADLRVAFLSGGSAGSALPKDAVASLHAASASSDFGGVDLLLSCAWPKGFYHHLDPTSLPADLLPGKDLPDVGLDALAGLAVTLRPRFHFCGGEDQFWQRPPFRLPASQHVCRLVGLSCVQEDKKQTWLKAFALVPAATMGGAAPPQPAETTDCPYPQALLVASAASGASAASPAASEQECNDFKLGKCTRGDKCRFRHVEGEPRAKRPKPDYAKDTRGWVSESCWFCTSSPQFESQLVASVGSACYLTLAKGPLVPNHCLLIPVSHAPCSLALSAEESAEMRTYLDALRTCFAKRGQAMLVFERHMGVSAGRAGFEHMHLQVLPLTPAAANGAREAFERLGTQQGITFELLGAGTPLRETLQPGEPFFVATLPSGEMLLHRIASNSRRHPLQFGRQAGAWLDGERHSHHAATPCGARSARVPPVDLRNGRVGAHARRRGPDAFGAFGARVRPSALRNALHPASTQVVAQLIGQPLLADWKQCMPKQVPGGPTVVQLEQEIADAFKAVFAEHEPQFDD